MAVLEDRVPGKPGRMLVTPENGGEAFYATLELADEPVVAGNKVNKQNVIDTIIEALSTGTLGTLRIESGSYVGSVNDAKTKTLTFGFAPSMVILTTVASSSMSFGLVIVTATNESADEDASIIGYPTSYYFNATGWGTNTITVQTTSTRYVYMDEPGYLYHYIAIG